MHLLQHDAPQMNHERVTLLLLMPLAVQTSNALMAQACTIRPCTFSTFAVVVMLNSLVQVLMWGAYLMQGWHAMVGASRNTTHRRMCRRPMGCNSRTELNPCLCLLSDRHGQEVDGGPRIAVWGPDSATGGSSAWPANDYDYEGTPQQQFPAPL